MSLFNGEWRLLLSTAVFIFALSNTSLALEVNVTNDGPAILDSTITFRVQLLGGEFSTLYYVFSHNVWTAAQPEMITNGTVAMLPMTFLSDRDLPGEYSMRVSVLKDYFFSKRKIAEGFCKFQLTRDIVGRIVVSQDGHILPDNQTIVSNNRTTNFTFELHDPSGYFRNSAKSLSWKLDHGPGHYKPYFAVNFTDTKDHLIGLIVVALVNKPDSTSPEVKVGSFVRSISPKGVHITNDGPAILDSTITFRAELLNSEILTARYVFRHNVPSAGQPEIVINGTRAVLPMTFLSTRDQPGEYLMVVSVLEDGSTNRSIAEGSCQFSLSRNIVGKIVASQGGHALPDNQTIVGTNQTTNFTFDLHDPSGFFNNSFKALSWKLDHGRARYDPYLAVNFTDTDVHSIYLTAVELVDLPNSTAPQIKLGSFIRIITPMATKSKRNTHRAKTPAPAEDHPPGPTEKHNFGRRCFRTRTAPGRFALKRLHRCEGWL